MNLRILLPWFPYTDRARWKIFLNTLLASTEKKKEYLHPKLKPILKSTYGIIVYQEQVMKIAQELAGFSLEEADILRKAIGKKIRKLLMDQKEKFIKGIEENG